MLNYLYYKLYQVVLKGSLKDIPEFIAPVYLGGLIGINLIVINAFLAKMNLTPFLFTSPKQGSFLIVFLIIVTFIFFGKTKRETVIKRYEVETNARRVKGNAIVSVYVGISFLLIFAVAFFKPGYLPK